MRNTCIYEMRPVVVGQVDHSQADIAQRCIFVRHVFHRNVGYDGQVFLRLYQVGVGLH